MVKTWSIVNSKFFKSAMVAVNYISTKTSTLENPDEGIITLAEVSLHDNIFDCWVVIYDRIYDITKFLYKHPGGSNILMKYAGRDASIAFHRTCHSDQALRILDQFLIGELPMHERIFRKPGGYRLRGVPE